MTFSGPPETVETFTITLNKRGNRHGWRCVCGRYESGLTETHALASAEGHCDWHAGQGAFTILQAGA